jgi:hypothetical protein
MNAVSSWLLDDSTELYLFSLDCSCQQQIANSQQLKRLGAIEGLESFLGRRRLSIALLLYAP